MLIAFKNKVLKVVTLSRTTLATIPFYAGSITLFLESLQLLSPATAASAQELRKAHQQCKIKFRQQALILERVPLLKRRFLCLFQRHCSKNNNHFYVRVTCATSDTRGDCTKV